MNEGCSGLQSAEYEEQEHEEEEKVYIWKTRNRRIRNIMVNGGYSGRSQD